MLGETTRSMLDALEEGRVTSESLVKAHLEAIESRDGEIGAFLDVFPEDADPPRGSDLSISTCSFPMKLLGFDASP